MSLTLLHSFDQGNMTVANDGVCCRLSYKWLAAQVNPGGVKHPSAIDQFSFNQGKTVEKQASYLKATAPWEKQTFFAARYGVSKISLDYLNVWGEKHGLRFTWVKSFKTCAGYFADRDRTVIIGITGKDAKQKYWGHATAFYSGSGGRRFFDPNKGIYDAGGTGAAFGAELEQFYGYLNMNPGDSIAQYEFFMLES